MSNAVAFFGEGDTSQRVNIQKKDEFGQLASKFNHMASQIEQANKEQAEYEQTLTSAKIEAESGEKSKAEFLAAMSHEIRTPMNSILGTFYLIKKTQLTDLQKRYIRTASHSGELLLKIINEI